MFPRILILLALAAPCSAQQWKVGRVLDVAPVWSGHPVGFDLLTHHDRQFVAFYDAARRLTVGARALTADSWDLVRLPSQLAWDSHNYVTMAIDRGGFIHLSGNMHAVPLVYFRTAKPLDIHTFEQVRAMTGRNESRCTYPKFFRNSAGDLIFTYRDGRSGDGNQIFNIYDETARAWRRLLDQPFTDGEGHRNAYFVGPIAGPDGWFHLVWTWRESPDCATNHDLSYARSKDLVHWESSGSKPLRLPITLATSDIVDPVPMHGGMINGNTRIGFDTHNRVVITYHKYDLRGFTQIVNARREDGAWKIYTTSNFAWRWDFSGGGSIHFEIRHGAVHKTQSGALELSYQHSQYGAGIWELDERTLKPIATRPPERAWPADLDRVESTFPGMQVRIQADSGRSPARYLLRWETLGENRDAPRHGDLPEPAMLRLFEILGPDSHPR